MNNSISNTSRGNGAYIAISKSFYGVKRKSNLESTKESVRIKISVSENINLLYVTTILPRTVKSE
jgi:hypothetical protein